MKNNILITATALIMALSFSPLSMASSSGHDASHGTDSHKTHDMSENTATMNHGAHSGEAMHSSMVGKYHFTYELIDMRKKMKEMENMPEMKATHHMMLFIKSHEGKAPEKAMVGFLIQNPDGTTQKIMAMGMGDGFGADVDFGKTGIYKIKVKAMAGEEKLLDTFEYEVK
ncbi:conserved exported hypothetical protein [Desulfamplus magnetovallimortis]|uniref:YtkA-like domain-containing protein n=1 Tax=Desulfamplus magnetovallimortis TaxID=1246637 RepID=A0A1W1HFU9_9BACT|nr:hypothetical protein [Desulfamplus magnetovallimortis]SLM31381.1 conserved exported hypothetical protein [Desulfamplus magnetovallimortis]